MAVTIGFSGMKTHYWNVKAYATLKKDTISLYGLSLRTLMNTNDNSLIPIYIKFFEREGKPLEQLIFDVEALSKEYSLESDVQLRNVVRSEKNTSLCMVVYCVQTKPLRQRHSASVGLFLDKIFSQLADKHPAYSEPLSSDLESIS